MNLDKHWPNSSFQLRLGRGWRSLLPHLRISFYTGLYRERVKGFVFDNSKVFNFGVHDRVVVGETHIALGWFFVIWGWNPEHQDELP